MVRVAIFYGIGGLSDVGRHAVEAAIERISGTVQPDQSSSGENEPQREKQIIDHITVITQHPKKLEETDWNCGCEQPHRILESLNLYKDKITIVPIEQSWDDVDLSTYLQDTPVIISCVGNREPFLGHWDATAGNNAIIRAIRKIRSATSVDVTTPYRIVVITSTGINEDWPAFEFFMIGRVAMSIIFLVLARKMYKDLTTMEKNYRAVTEELNIDFLFVRPCGIGEDVLPINSWSIQKEKFKDTLAIEISKLDVARYMIKEGLYPTQHKTAVVIGLDPTMKIPRIDKITKQNKQNKS